MPLLTERRRKALVSLLLVLVLYLGPTNLRRTTTDSSDSGKANAHAQAKATTNDADTLHAQTSDTDSDTDSDRDSDSLRQRLFRWLERRPRWKLALASVTGYFIARNALLLLFGVGGENANPLAESHYSPTFKRLRRQFTGLDAGIIRCQAVSNDTLRGVLSLILGVYYIIRHSAAESVMHRFHQNPSIRGIRECWQKGRNPVIWRISQSAAEVRALRVGVHRRPVTIYGRDDGRPIIAYLYHQGDDASLRRVRRVIVHFPGGGFVAMDPTHHECYLRHWADYLPDCAIVSVDYRKAPEFPYPSGLNDCYDVYAAVVASNGRCLGIDCESDSVSDCDCESESECECESVSVCESESVSTVVTGDSAGGTLAAAVTLRAIGEGLPLPAGVVLGYPCLDLDMNMLRAHDLASDHCSDATTAMSLLQKGNESADSANSNNSICSDFDGGQAGIGREFDYSKHRRHGAFTRMALEGTDSLLNSHTQYFADGVLPLSYTLLLADAYLPPWADPRNDPLVSPLNAPRCLLAAFPPCRIHVGDADPLADDSRRFARVLRRYQTTPDVELVEFEGLSHAYIQAPPAMLPAARFCCELAVKWMAQLLDCEISGGDRFTHLSASL